MLEISECNKCYNIPLKAINRRTVRNRTAKNTVMLSSQGGYKYSHVAWLNCFVWLYAEANVGDLWPCSAYKQVYNQSSGAAAGGAATSLPDWVCRGWRSQECHEAARLRESHREKSSFRGALNSPQSNFQWQKYIIILEPLLQYFLQYNIHFTRFSCNLFHVQKHVNRKYKWNNLKLYNKIRVNRKDI